MKLPESWFVAINPVVRVLLTSPLHGLLSSSVMLISFTGRRSGKLFTTPVRFIRAGEKIHCFTGTENQWWRNMRQPVTVDLRMGGRSQKYTAQAVSDDPARVKEALSKLLAAYPQDAPYYDIQVDKSGNPEVGELEKAAQRTVLVEATAIAANAK